MERNICKRLDVNMRKEKFDNFRVRCVKSKMGLSSQQEVGKVDKEREVPFPSV